MGFSLKKLVKHVGADLNPFDGPPKPQPASTAHPGGIGGVIHNVASTVNRDVIHPVQTGARDVGGAVAATNRFLNTAGTGVQRSAIGTAQGFSGIADLASKGTGTSRVSKYLDQSAKNVDASAKKMPFPAVYKPGQATGDAASFVAGGELLDAAKAIPKVAKVAEVLSKVPNPVAKPIESLAEKGFGGRVTSQALKTASNPTYQAGNAAYTALQTGKEASQGKKTTPLSVGENLAAGSVGIPLTTGLVHETVAPAAKAAVKGLRDTNLIRPSRLNPQEVGDLAAFRQHAGNGAITDQGIYERGVAAAQKAGIDYRDPTQVDTLLGAHRTYDTRVLERKQALAGAQQRLTPANEIGSIGKNVKGENIPTASGPQPKLETQSPRTAQVGKPEPTVAPRTSSAKNTPFGENLQKAGLAPKQTRGFTKNIDRNNVDNNPTAQTVVDSIPGYKPIKNKNTIARATKEINKDPEAAYARIATKPQLTTADDVTTGNLLLKQAIERGDTEAAVQIGTKLGMDGTKLGQAVQAYATYKRSSPEGIISYAAKQAARAGKTVDTGIAKDLIERAQRIAEMPEGLERAKATRELIGSADKLGQNWKDRLSEILSTPRALMATADFSAPFRQGAILGSRYPKQFSKAFGESAKYMFNPKYYEKEMYELTQRPRYELMKSTGLSVGAGENLTGTEEQFLDNILESKVSKKLLVGHVIAASDRAYSGFLTKLRADVYDHILDNAQQAGVNYNRKQLTSLSKFINSASGRGDGSITRQVSRLQVLFSARLWKSRLDTLNPAYYARLDPEARKFALQSAASFAAITTTILGLAKASGMADVGADPRSADFGKIKVGDTRYDVLSGLQQNIRLGAQLATGKKINSQTGEVQTLGADRGFGKPSRLDLLYQFLENKENPLIAYGTKALRGTDQVGQPVNLATEAGKLAIPLNAQSVYSTAKDVGSLPKSLAMNAPGIFGVGVQTYGSTKPTLTKDQQQQLAALPNQQDKQTFLNRIQNDLTKKSGGGSKAGTSAVDALKQTEKTQKDLLKGSLSDEDYKLSTLSKKERQKLIDNGSYTQAKFDGLDKYVTNKKQQLGIETASSKVNASVPKPQKDFLTKYNATSKAARDKAAYSQNDYDYNYAVAKYANDKANGTLSKAADIKARDAIDKAKVGKDYSKDVRDLYSLSKGDIYDFITSDKNGNKYANDLMAYDQALKGAGLISSAKFRNGFGSDKSGGARRSGGRGSSNTKFAAALKASNSAAKSNQTALQNLIKGAKVHSPNSGNTKLKVARANLKKQSINKQKAKVA
jgi:hypothetical protein